MNYLSYENKKIIEDIKSNKNRGVLHYVVNGRLFEKYNLNSKNHYNNNVKENIKSLFSIMNDVYDTMNSSMRKKKFNEKYKSMDFKTREGYLFKYFYNVLMIFRNIIEHSSYNFYLEKDNIYHIINERDNKNNKEVIFDIYIEHEVFVSLCEVICEFLLCYKENMNKYDLEYITYYLSSFHERLNDEVKNLGSCDLVCFYKKIVPSTKSIWHSVKQKYRERHVIKLENLDEFNLSDYRKECYKIRNDVNSDIECKFRDFDEYLIITKDKTFLVIGSLYLNNINEWEVNEYWNDFDHAHFLGLFNNR